MTGLTSCGRTHVKWNVLQCPEIATLNGLKE